jgi:hypothetical protein
VVSDAVALTSTMLQVLPVCSPSIQRQLIGILPEVAQQQDHGVVLEQLQGLLEADVTFMAPVVECLSNMMLDAAVQVGNQGASHQQQAQAYRHYNTSGQQPKSQQGTSASSNENGLRS